MSERMSETDRREVDVLIEAGHPSRPDREELMRQHIDRIKARARAEALKEAAHEIEHSVMPNHPNAGYRDGHAHAAWVVRSLVTHPTAAHPGGDTTDAKEAQHG